MTLASASASASANVSNVTTCLQSARFLEAEPAERLLGPIDSAHTRHFGSIFGYCAYICCCELPSLHFGSLQARVAMICPAIIMVGSSIVALVIVVYVYHQIWRSIFLYVRVDRSHHLCPSHRLPPEVTAEERWAKVTSAVEQRRISKEGSAARLISRQSTSPLSEAKATGALRRLPSKDLVHGSPVMKVDTERKAAELDMDHIYLDFLDFLWAQVFVGACALCLAVCGTISLIVRQALHKRTWLEPKPYDPRKVVARMLLETTEIINFLGVAINEQDPSKPRIASFIWPKFPILDACGDFDDSKTLYVEVDLEQKSMVSAEFDRQHLTAEEAMTLVWFHLIFANHVKIHALANWGTNVHSHDPCLRRNSVATVAYNYFGYTVFPILSHVACLAGVISFPCTALTKVFDAGVTTGVPFHANVRELQRDSTMCNFVIKVRHGFMKIFEKHKAAMGGMDGEALFAGTVLHSLDHTMSAIILEDPLWLDVGSDKFGHMAEIGRFVRAGFVDDIKGVYFNRRMKNLKHPFYKDVYNFAKKVNAFLADNMDTCIIK
ncbi:unnamed protein product [Prorocentrum cordatum]|uniref:Uncharacterized protein n=1 Tax=Prorocentrum cordatum TaxID=2364126 RepID=A0ABN9QVK1_9DINO|nr:unnamed protein product [Polarella glacialis]